jgi:hypothetical protein
MRNLLLSISAAMIIAPLMHGDVITFTNNYGTALGTIPAYYPIQDCVGNSCTAIQTYPLTVASNTIPGAVYISDPSGNVSDSIVSTIQPLTTCTPQPSCLGLYTQTMFVFTSGLDMTGSPETCASVGGCAFVYSGSVQTIGTITWGPGLFIPPALYGDTTTLEYQSLIGTLLTATLTNFEGGSSADPTLLPTGTPVGQVTGTIGASGSEDYYSFYWTGGFFSATESVTGMPTGSFTFSYGSGNCSSGGSVVLNAGDSFTGTLSANNLAQGTYCIGIANDGPGDPPYVLTFNTPTALTPEPSTFALLVAGLGMGALRLRRR